MFQSHFYLQRRGLEFLPRHIAPVDYYVEQIVYASRPKLLLNPISRPSSNKADFAAHELERSQRLYGIWKQC